MCQKQALPTHKCSSSADTSEGTHSCGTLGGSNAQEKRKRQL
jgi:hypothetical protein